jgi:1-acyl-sn-glycerol-3-phosphate acyltransferase
VTVAAVGWLWISDPVIRALRRLSGSKRSPGPRRARVFQRWARAAAWVLGMRVQRRGDPPRPPFLLVSNHVSYMDIVLLGTQAPCIFVAKAEVADWPLVGRMCKSVETMFIDRERKRDLLRVTKQVESTIAGGAGVAIFPEGTSTKGESVLRFNPSLLQAAARAEFPVSCATLYYETLPGYPPAGRSICWWGGAEFVPHGLDLLRMPSFHARVTFGEGTIRGTDRKELATRLHAAVEGKFQPMLDGSQEMP